MQQGLLPLGYAQSHELCDFVVANCNQMAFELLHAALQGITKDKFICIYGEPGCGKTHLFQGFAKEYNLAYTTANQALTTNPWDWIYGEQQILILDDAHKVEDDVWWFHLYNLVKEQNKLLIIGTTKPPSMWPAKLADWRSRLATFISAEMHNPDDDTLKRVLTKIWKDKGIVVDSAILEYLSRRIDRNFPAICHWAHKIDTLSAQQRRPITVSMLHHLFAA